MKFLIFALLFLVGCSQVPAPDVPSKTDQLENNGHVVPDPQTSYVADWPNPAWSQMAAKALKELGGDLLKITPVDIDYYCNQVDPREAWARTDKIAFWVMQISALARFESGFNPSTSYQEDFRDQQGNYVISRGLLQLSQESANGYGCNITNAQQLHDPETNIRCGVRILNRWVARDKAIASSEAPWKGAARYWSPFRSAEKKAAMRLKTRQVCK